MRNDNNCIMKETYFYLAETNIDKTIYKHGITCNLTKRLSVINKSNIIGKQYEGTWKYIYLKKYLNRIKARLFHEEFQKYIKVNKFRIGDGRSEYFKIEDNEILNYKRKDNIIKKSGQLDYWFLNKNLNVEEIHVFNTIFS